MTNMLSLIDKFEKYLESADATGEPFLEDIWIRSNKYYIFFGESAKMGKTYAMFSKKYMMTIELTKDKSLQGIMNKISVVSDAVREKMGMKIEKYQFWLPHCIVNGITVETKLIAESYGISSELALDYLIQYDDIFSKIYDRKKKTYFGLPLLATHAEAENYILRDNTRVYLRDLKRLNKLLKS